MPNERFTYLLQQYLQNQINEPELHELTAILLENEHNEAFQEEVEALMRNTPAEEYRAQEWEPVYRQIIGRTAPVRPLYKRWLPYAAALIVIASGAWWWMTHRTPAPPAIEIATSEPVILPGSNRAVLTLANGQQVLLDSMKGNLSQLGAQHVSNSNGRLDYEKGGDLQYHTLSTPRGGQYQLLLPDGTVIWLNAASTLHYPTAFIGKERVVELSGEAYLEVAKRPDQPFVVKVNGTEVRVLGTKFNINAYPNDPQMSTTLLEGKVQVKPSSANHIQLTTLLPGDQAILSADTLHLQHHADTGKALAWKNGLFDFNDADLPTVMRQLERWYNIRVLYAGTIPAVTWHGKMDRGINFSEVLDILTRMEIKYKLDQRTLTILP